MRVAKRIEGSMPLGKDEGEAKVEVEVEVEKEVVMSSSPLLRLDDGVEEEEEEEVEEENFPCSIILALCFFTNNNCGCTIRFTHSSITASSIMGRGTGKLVEEDEEEEGEVEERWLIGKSCLPGTHNENRGDSHAVRRVLLLEGERGGYPGKDIEDIEDPEDIAVNNKEEEEEEEEVETSM